MNHSTRKKNIQTLEILMKSLKLDKDEIDALQFAIDSIKVDLAYDLMYEKVDFIEIPKGATNGDMIKAMFPNFHTDEMSHTVWVGYDDMSFRREWWNSPYRKEQE